MINIFYISSSFYYLVNSNSNALPNSLFSFNFLSKYLSGPSYFLQRKLTKIGHLAALYIGVPESNLIEVI